VIDWYQNTIRSRLNKQETPIIVIMQRLHENDLSGWLLNGGSGETWEHLNIPARDGEGKSFWPAQFPDEMLDRLETSSPYVYAGQYMQRPAPIGGVIKPRVTQINRIEIGSALVTNQRGQQVQRTTGDESLMLTGDGNIVDIAFQVQWQIDPARPENFVFNIQNPEGSIRTVSESAMREVIGRRAIQPILTTERGAIEVEVRQLVQDTLNSYNAGVLISGLQMLKADPPAQVIEAFRDVQAAQQDQNRLRNEAETYASRVVPEARGQAARLVQEAEAYRERSVAEATGQASRFTQISGPGSLPGKTSRSIGVTCPKRYTRSRAYRISCLNRRSSGNGSWSMVPHTFLKTGHQEELGVCQRAGRVVPRAPHASRSRCGVLTTSFVKAPPKSRKSSAMRGISFYVRKATSAFKFSTFCGFRLRRVRSADAPDECDHRIDFLGS
jgi:HflK protein